MGVHFSKTYNTIKPTTFNNQLLLNDEIYKPPEIYDLEQLGFILSYKELLKLEAYNFKELA